MNEAVTRALSFDAQELPALRAMAYRFANIDTASIEIARLEGMLQLPKGTVHVITDVHGEFKKLQHVLHNASGSLRPLVEEVFGQCLTAEEKGQLLNVIYYPEQMFQHLHVDSADTQVRTAFVQEIIRWQFAVLAALARHYTLRQVVEVFPLSYRPLFLELFWEAEAERPTGYVDTMLEALCRQAGGLQAVHWASRVIRHLSVAEVVVAGDMGDRGARLDKVMEILMDQPRLAITWGNHDVSWMGACLGQEALIATVLRISLRHRRLSQLEEGFGVTLQPLEKLARDVYGDDPARQFQGRGEGLREAIQIARMHKAITILQFKLEAQAIARHPEYRLPHRALINQLDVKKGTVRLDGRDYPLTDTAFPTLDPREPSVLSAEELLCMARLKQSFLDSAILREQMTYLARHGSSFLVRDGHLIFHGCVPVDADGNLLPLPIDGAARVGRAMFTAIDGVVQRAFRERRADDLDLLWYLWAGPLSPMFGKDKMTTFEGYFIADEPTRRETLNPYFRLIDTPAFCRRVLAEFDVDPGSGMIVNGHVRVKEGERPLRNSGQAIRIDGAFSESYGDRGYTLILDSAGTHLAEHHHFESIATALTQGIDIIPRMEEVRRYSEPRRVRDTESGANLRNEIAMLERLVAAYRDNVLPEAL